LRLAAIAGDNRVKKLKETLVKVPLVRAWVEAGLARNPMRTRCWAAIEIFRRTFLMESNQCDTVLLSYPRSGNHLVRYVVEYCSHQPTLGHADHEKWLIPRQLTDDPIFLRTNDVKVFKFRPKLLKRHHLDVKCEKLILLTRNPVTSILSQHGRDKAEIAKEVLDAQFEVFMRNLNAFLEFDESKRLLISLESIETDPIDELSKVLKFIGVSNFEEDLAEVAANLDRGKAVLQREARPDLSASYLNLLPLSYQYLSAKFREVDQLLVSAGLRYKF
jgi:hypothetical protein